MTRIEIIRDYLIEVLDNMQKDFEVMNVNFLSNKPDNYSLNKLPISPIIEKFITGATLCRDVYELRSRNRYSSNDAENLENIGFWEKFEEIISENNKCHKLPLIEGIQSINCLNCGSLAIAQTQTCEMSIQLEIIYLKEV